MTQQGQHGFDTAVYTQTDPLGGNTGPGAKSVVYDCVALLQSGESGTGAQVGRQSASANHRPLPDLQAATAQEAQHSLDSLTFCVTTLTIG